MLKNSTEKFKVYKVGHLLPESQDEFDNFERRERDARSAPGKPVKFNINDMPMIELGDFEISPLKNYLPENKTKKHVKDDYSYFVVQFPLNFYPDDFQVDNVKFSVNFSVDNSKDVRVVDLYPREKVEEIKRNINLVISPSISFSEISAKAGDLSFNFVYDEIRPIVYGSGMGRPHAYWNLHNSFTYYIAGAKIMHAIIKVASEAKILTISADLQAAIRVGNRLINFIFGVEDGFAEDSLFVSFDLKTCSPISKV